MEKWEINCEGGGGGGVGGSFNLFFFFVGFIYFVVESCGKLCIGLVFCFFCVIV